MIFLLLLIIFFSSFLSVDRFWQKTIPSTRVSSSHSPSGSIGSLFPRDVKKDWSRSNFNNSFFTSRYASVMICVRESLVTDPIKIDFSFRFRCLAWFRSWKLFFALSLARTSILPRRWIPSTKLKLALSWFGELFMALKSRK